MRKIVLLIVVLVAALCIDISFAQKADESYRAAVIAAQKYYENQDASVQFKLVSLANKAPKGEFVKTDTSSNVQWCLESDTMIYVTIFCNEGSYYDRFEVGSKVNTNEFPSWVTTPNELNRRFVEIDNESSGRFNPIARLAQMLGMPIPDNSSNVRSKIITLKVAQSRLFRPAFNPNPNSSVVTYKRDYSYSLQNWSGYNRWFENNCNATFPSLIQQEITDSHYPFTALGYTYDWCEDADEYYGLSEFVIIPHTDVTIVDNQLVWDYLGVLILGNN